MVSIWISAIPLQGASWAFLYETPVVLDWQSRRGRPVRDPELSNLGPERLRPSGAWFGYAFGVTLRALLAAPFFIFNTEQPTHEALLASP